jgi:hypothetical protein
VPSKQKLLAPFGSQESLVPAISPERLWRTPSPLEFCSPHSVAALCQLHKSGPSSSSVVKAVANLDEDFAWIYKVCAAKGEAVVEQDAAVSDVDSVHADREFLRKILG